MELSQGSEMLDPINFCDFIIVQIEDLELWKGVKVALKNL